MLSLSINERLKDYAFATKLTLDISQTDFVDRLKRETWSPDATGYGHNRMSQRYTARYDQLRDPFLKELNEYTFSTEFRSTVVHHFYQHNQHFVRDWSLSPKQMIEGTTSGARFIMDTPGLDLNTHLDNRMQVFTGMIYFNNVDNPLQSTTFYNTGDNQDPVVAQTNFGHGWVMANLHNSWHSGGNRDSHDRYSMLFNISLKLAT